MIKYMLNWTDIIVILTIALIKTIQCKWVSIFLNWELWGDILGKFN